MKLLDSDLLFQTLLREAFPDAITVAADLDVGSNADLPLITHYSTATQSGNGNGLWQVNLTITMICETGQAFDLANAIYAAVWSWHYPTNGIVPGVGAVEYVEDVTAPSRVGGEAQMEAKQVVQYGGTWTIRARNY